MRSRRPKDVQLSDIQYNHISVGKFWKVINSTKLKFWKIGAQLFPEAKTKNAENALARQNIMRES